MCMLGSSIIYTLELAADVPDDVGLHSIADGFYFIVVTFSTVGCDNR